MCVLYKINSHFLLRRFIIWSRYTCKKKKVSVGAVPKKQPKLHYARYIARATCRKIFPSRAHCFSNPGSSRPPPCACALCSQTVFAPSGRYRSAGISGYTHSQTNLWPYHGSAGDVTWWNKPLWSLHRQSGICPFLSCAAHAWRAQPCRQISAARERCFYFMATELEEASRPAKSQHVRVEITLKVLRFLVKLSSLPQ
jgi:hypothetical protein